MNYRMGYAAVAASWETTTNMTVLAGRWKHLAESCENPVYRMEAQERADLLSSFLKPLCAICAHHHNPEEVETCAYWMQAGEWDI